MGQAFNQMILGQVQAHHQQIASLKKIAPIWPQVRCKNLNADDIAITTLVRIEREGKYYLIHHVQTAYKVPLGGNLEWLYEQLIVQVHLCLVCYKLTGIPGLEELDPNQQPEPERLKRFFNPTKK